MRETLYIRWRDDLREPLAYAFVAAEAAGSAIPKHALIDDILALAPGRRIVLIVPGSSVHLASVDIPTRQTSKVLQAAPYLLEEQLADDVDTLHYAIGPRQPGGQYPVAVVNQAELESWLAPFREQDIEVEAVVPDTLCLPLPDPEPGAAWPALVEAGLITLRSGPYTGFCCPPEDLRMYLELAESDSIHRNLLALLCEGCDSELDCGDRSVELRPGYGSGLQALVQHYKPAHSINLLQGRYSRRDHFQRAWRPWRKACALLVVVLAVAWMTNVIQAVRLGHAANVQQQANAQRFHSLFPDEPTTLALSLAIQQVAANAGQGNPSGGAWLPLLEQTAQALDAAKGFSVREVQYHDHALYVTLAGKDLRALDRLRNWFTRHPAVHLDVQSANAGGNKVKVTIKVTAS